MGADQDVSVLGNRYRACRDSMHQQTAHVDRVGVLNDTIADIEIRPRPRPFS